MKNLKKLLQLNNTIQKHVFWIDCLKNLYENNADGLRLHGFYELKLKRRNGDDILFVEHLYFVIMSKLDAVYQMVNTVLNSVKFNMESRLIVVNKRISLLLIILTIITILVGGMQLIGVDELKSFFRTIVLKILDLFK